MNAQQKIVNNIQFGMQSVGIGGGGNKSNLMSGKKKHRQMNKYILQFKEKQLEIDFNNSQTKQLSRYSYKIFVITVIPLLITFFLLPFSSRSGGIQVKVYIYYVIPIVVFIANIIVQKKFPNLFDYTHTLIVIILHLLISWQMVDNDITTFNSFSEFYKGFIFANIYIFLYISTRYTTKVVLILIVNISGIFIFPHHSNIWILVVGQVFLMLMLTVKFYNEDLMKRQLFVQTRKQNLWDSIIEEFLPINLIVVKYNKTTQRLELTQANKCASRKLRIVSDDDLQHFLDYTIIETNENTTTSFMNNFQAPTQNNLIMDKNSLRQSNLFLTRQASQIPKGGLTDLSKSFNQQIYMNQNGAKNAHSDKFTLKKLLKNKLLKQLDQKNQTPQQQHEQERTRKQSQGEGGNGDTTFTNNQKNTNNTFENLEHYSANFVSEKGNQKKLAIKVFTFCLVDNYAVMTIESESFKSKLRKEQKKSEFHQTFYKEIIQRFERNCKNLVVQLSSQLRSFGSENSSLTIKLKEILEIGYEMLILNKNVTDFMSQQERTSRRHQSQKKTNLTLNGKNRSLSNNRGGLAYSSNSNKMGPFSISNSITSKKQILEICEFYPGKEIFGWLSIFQSKLEQKRLHIFHEIDEMLGIVTNHKNKFNQIVFNLLENAIKFTPPNGKIAIIVKRNLISSHVIDVHLINTIEKDLDTFPLIRDLESNIQDSQNFNTTIFSNNLIGDDDYYNVLRKIKLGIPVSRKLIQQIGPNNQLNYKFKNNQILLHFQIFSDIRILKDNFEDSPQVKSATKSTNGERTIFQMKIPTLDRENILQLQKKNTLINRSTQSNIKESKSNPYSNMQSATSLTEIGLGKQHSLNYRFNHQSTLGSQNSMAQQPLIVKRLNSNQHQNGQSQENQQQINGRSQQNQKKNKSRSLSNPFQQQNQIMVFTQNQSNTNVTNELIPSNNDLMFDMANSPDPISQQSSVPKLLSEIQQMNQTFNSNQPQNNNVNGFHKKNSFSVDKADKLKNHISIIQESVSENTIDNSNNNFYFKSHNNGIKSTNKLLSSQKLLLKETELDVIRSQKIALATSLSSTPRRNNLNPSSPPSIEEQATTNIFKKQKNLNLKLPDKIFQIGERINNQQVNGSTNLNVNQSTSNVSNSKVILNNKNANTRRLNASGVQTPDTAKGSFLFKEVNSPLEKSNANIDYQPSVYNSMESQSLNFLKQHGLTSEKQGTNNRQLSFFPNKNIQEYFDENGSMKKDYLPYIPKISSSHDQDQQLSFDGWQNVDEQHNDSFQKWMEISTLRKYNELEFNQAFKPLQNNRQSFNLSMNQRSDILILPQDKSCKQTIDSKSKIQSQNFTFIHDQ